MSKLAAPRTGWGFWFAGAIVAVGAADLTVLATVKAFLGSGYNGHALSGWMDVAGFLLVGAACDAALLAALWALFAGLLRPIVDAPRRTALALGVAAATPVLTDVALHKLHATLGDVLALDLVVQLAEGDEVGALEEVAAALPSYGLLAVTAIAGAGTLWWGSGWLAKRLAPMRGGDRRRAAAVVLALCVGGVALSAARLDATWRFGLGWKPSGMVLTEMATRLTDFDFDGAGAISLPVDAAPFDSAQHPFALEIAGNGIDENGLAGDLPHDFTPSRPLDVHPISRVPGAPHVVVLVFLESFRADLIGATLEGRMITPHLNRLSREGAASEQAYTHAPMTWPARTSLLQGRVVATAHAPTLVDDFKQAGFRVGWFSGQHDGLRDGADYLGYEGADAFSDARSHLDQRTSRSAQPISLQTSWQTVLGDVEAFLSNHPPDLPLFLYVNFTDTHFPYDHSRLDPILTDARLDRSQISRANRSRVWEAYANAAANVDRGVGALRATLEQRFPGERIGILATADHGQAFYETRFLGHGQSLDRHQTGVPFITYQLGGVWPEPIALSDVRGLLARAASSADSRGDFVGAPDRALFQFAGNPENPRLIGLRTLAGTTLWNPHADEPQDEDAGFARLIHTWEATRTRADDAARD